MALFLLIMLIILLVVGFPMFVVMLLPTVAAMPIYLSHAPLFVLVQRTIAGISPFPLVAVPLFIFAADIMVKGEMARRLTDLAEVLVGHLPGGLAHTTTLSCMIFGAVSGSTQAAVAAIGTTMHPWLIKHGYHQSFATALIINASDVAQLIPPSIFMIVFGVISGASVAALFMAGLVPGILLGLSFMAYSWFYARKYKIPRMERASRGEVWKAIKRASGPLGFVVIIIGGIYSGIFSPTEASGVAVAYALVLEICVYRSIKVGEIPRVALTSGITHGMIFILIGGATAFIWLLTIARIPYMAAQLITAVNPSPLGLLFIINGIFFIALMFFNPISAMLVLTPIFLPISRSYGINPVHLGALITLNAAIGSATPPFGCDIFTACAIFRLPFYKVIKGVPPFIMCGIIVLIITMIFPDLVLFLPRLLFS